MMRSLDCFDLPHTPFSFELDDLQALGEERSFTDLQTVAGMHGYAVDQPFTIMSPDYSNKNWPVLPPSQWTTDDVLDWVYDHVSNTESIELGRFDGESFQKIDGRKLCGMTLNDFLLISEKYGRFFHEKLQELLNGQKFAESLPSDCLDQYLIEMEMECCIPNWEEIDPSLKQLTDGRDSVMCSSMTLPSIRSFIDPQLSAVHGCPALDSAFDLDPDLESTFDCSDLRRSGIDRLPALSVDSGIESGNSSPITDCDRYLLSVIDSNLPITAAASSPYPFLTAAVSRPAVDPVRRLPSPLHGASRRPGRPRKSRLVSECSSSSTTSSSSDGESSTLSSPTSLSSAGSSDGQLPPIFRRRRENKSKTPHLWKFMRALLEDATYNPEYIRWENKDEGVFRIVPGQSKHIAVLWGQKKNNPTMTFDKLSRSLRWCRTYGFLSEVPKNGRYPKKLCFRFAPHAMNWQPDAKCLQGS